MRIFQLVLLLSVTGNAIGAQASPRESMCDSVRALASVLRLPAKNSAQWRDWLAFRSCGAAGEHAAAVSLQNAAIRRESDPARAQQYFEALRGLRSNDLLTAFENLSGDASASTPMRAGAINSLGELVRGSSNFDVNSAEKPTAPCRLRFLDVVRIHTAGGLPADLRQRIFRDVALIASDGNAPQVVRALATCWQKSLAPPAAIDPARITLRYVCGDRFEIRNDNGGDVNIRYDVAGTSESQELTIVAGKPSRIATDTVGLVRLFYNGKLIRSSRNAQIECLR